MKTIIVSLFGLAALALPSCTTVVEPTTRSTTTTTDVTAPAVYGTTQTRTTRTY